MLSLETAASPLVWERPEWCSQFPGADAEFEELRELAVALQRCEPSLKVRLRLPEPGLMYLAVGARPPHVAEVYSVESPEPAGGRLLAIYAFPETDDETEGCEDSIPGAVNWIRACLVLA